MWDSTECLELWKTVQAVSPNTRRATSMRFGSCTPGRIFQRNKDSCSHKSLYVSIYGSCGHNSQTWKQSDGLQQVSGYTARHPHAMESHAAVSKDEQLTRGTPWTGHGRWCWVQRANSRSHTLSDPIYVTFLRWQNYRNRQQINGCQKWKRQDTEGNQM